MRIWLTLSVEFRVLDSLPKPRAACCALTASCRNFSPGTSGGDGVLEVTGCWSGVARWAERGVRWGWESRDGAQRSCLLSWGSGDAGMEGGLVGEREGSCLVLARLRNRRHQYQVQVALGCVESTYWYRRQVLGVSQTWRSPCGPYATAGHTGGEGQGTSVSSLPDTAGVLCLALCFLQQ